MDADSGVTGRWLSTAKFISLRVRCAKFPALSATHDFASLHITPGIRLKFRPASKSSPYAVVGGGYANYEQSLTQIDGRPTRHRGSSTAASSISAPGLTFTYGDLSRFAAKFAISTPVRPITMSHRFRAGQHNVVATGAFVLRWH
jgi:hypothetical protein